VVHPRSGMGKEPVRELVLEVDGLAVAFGGLRALAGASLHARRGEILGIIGPNGAGKTTLFNAITGQVRAAAGSVVFRGRPILGLRPSTVARLGIARTFQVVRPFAGLTVLENVMVPLGLRRYGRLRSLALRRQGRGQARRLLRRVDLQDHEASLPGQLPIAHQRRLELARALALDPYLLLLDEPAAGLIHQEAVELMGLIRAVRDQGCTVLLVEHNMEVAMGVCDRLYVLDRGAVIAEGPPDMVREDPLVVSAYLGSDED